ncbi:MAG: hypothetical protein IIU94_01150, partial [Alistipes sp.]|nr:hypothetical protein [Alistipes sp.]
MSTITLRNVYGREKKYYLQPSKQKNGTNLPFVKKVRATENGDSEMILSPNELNDPMEKNLWDAIKDNPVIAPERDARDSNGVLLIDGTQERYGRADFYIEREG